MRWHPESSNNRTADTFGSRAVCKNDADDDGAATAAAAAEGAGDNADGDNDADGDEKDTDDEDVDEAVTVGGVEMEQAPRPAFTNAAVSPCASPPSLDEAATNVATSSASELD
mmetsp:Transcript_2256/g.4832  ORF Transcript_2256/g.4832 Transcript_2256/m.4832 type:complete len:113 (-) Transcript_2256:903-1241(-)